MTDTAGRSVTRLRRLGVLAGAAILLSGVIVGCGNSDEDATPTTAGAASDLPVATGVWARAAKAGGNTAIYMSIAGGKSKDQLLKVATDDDLADSVEIHETTTAEPDEHSDHNAHDDHGDHGDMGSDMGGGMKTMRPVDMIEVPAGKKVELAPGGYHVMVMDLRSDLSVGDSIPITLTFKNAGEIRATAQVRES